MSSSDVQRAMRLSMESFQEEEAMRRALQASLESLSLFDRPVKKDADEDEELKKALQASLSEQKDDLPAQYVFLGTDEFLEKNTPCDMVQAVISATFPGSHGFQITNVRGDGLCLRWSLEQGTETPLDAHRFIRGCKAFARLHGETYIEVRTGLTFHLHEGSSDEELLEFWNRVMSEAGDLPSNMVRIFQYVFECRIVCLSYDDQSAERNLTATLYEDYEPPSLGGFEDVTKYVIIFNNGGHYWLIDNHDIEQKYNVIQLIRAQCTPFEIFE
jgi:hypothetical protein